MRAVMLRRLTALIALMWFGSYESATAQERPYPSLSRRPVESRDRDAEVAAEAAAVQAAATKPVSVDKALSGNVATLADKASAASGAFEQQYGDMARSVAGANGASVGSENWVVAERAISRLDALRYDSVAALAALDTLYIEHVDGSDPARVTADSAVIDTARRRVLAMVDRQNDRLDALKAGLVQP